MKKVAILGATGYIGRSLAEEILLSRKDYELYLFSRNRDALPRLFSEAVKKSTSSHHFLSLDEFGEGKYDTIINASGIGDPKVLAEDARVIFSATESVDNLVLSYLKEVTGARYVNLSSGAVYGKSSAQPITDKTEIIFSGDFNTSSEFYSLAKLSSEAKHRANSHLPIIDLRVFAFFSHLVDRKGSFLMSQITEAIVEKKVFFTGPTNIERDFITPSDLLSLIEITLEKGESNDVYDVFSKSQVSKFELLEHLKNEFGLVYQVSDEENFSVTIKNSYYSKNKKAASLGYEPEYSSLGGITKELKKLGL